MWLHLDALFLPYVIKFWERDRQQVAENIINQTLHARNMSSIKFDEGRNEYAEALDLIFSCLKQIK